MLFSVIGAPNEIKEHASQLAEALFLYRRPMPDGSDPGVGIRKLIDDLVAQKMAAPGGDWLSHVVTHRGEAGLELTDDEVHGAVTAMLGGGHHSTARGLACLLTEILKDPELQAQLRANPKQIPAIAEESLRRHTPLRWFARTASDDVEVGGQSIRKGDHVYLLYGAGNLDPKQFPDPDNIDPAGRKNSAHLAFGWGMHRCVGMPLAQLELRIAVAELLAATTDIQLTGEITWSAAVEPRNIPVRLIGFVPPEDD